MYYIDMKNKIKKVLKFLDPMNSLDDFLFNNLNESFYYKHISDVKQQVEDLAFFAIFGQDYDTVFQSFYAPGDRNKDNTRPVIWDNGFPPETIYNLLFNAKDMNIDLKIKKIKKQVKIMKKAKKEFKK